jgi:predicted permease
MQSLWQDIRYGLKALARNPGFAFAAVVTLALGIGANTAIFSVADAVLFRPFPVREPGQLAVLYTTSTTDSRFSSTSYPDYLDYAGLREVFSGLLAYARIPVVVNTGRHADRIYGEVVSGNYFDVLGLTMPLGRGFLPEEDRTTGSQPVVVISHGFWRRNFGSDPNIVGKTVLVDEQSFMVVGVAPEKYRGITLDWSTPPDIWLPMAMLDRVVPNWPRGVQSMLQRRDARWLLVAGRLREGVTLERAQAAARLAARQLELAYDKTNRGWTATLLPSSEARFWPTYRKSVVSFLALLAAVAGFVLLITCSNVANLLLARAAARQKEVAIRVALGASRIRLLRQLVTESLLLSGLGMILSILVAVWIFGLLARFPGAFRIPIALEMGVDGRVVSIGVAFALLTALVFGLFPAYQATRPDVSTALQEKSGTGTLSSKSRLRGGLVAAQVALSTVLLVGAGLFVRALQQARSVDPGFRPENVLILSIDFNTVLRRYDEARGMEFYRRLLERVRELPGVRLVTWAGDVPLAVRRLIVSFVKEDQTVVGENDWVRTDGNVVGPRYLETLGILLVRGRDFTDADNESAMGAVIINEAMARRYWPGEDPVGKRIRVNGRARELYQIIGVAMNVRQRSLWEYSGPYVYLPLYQRYFPEMMLHVKTAGDPMAMLPSIRRQVETLDPDLPVFDVGSLSEQIDKTLSQQRMAAALLSASALLALILASVGVYGVLAYSVAQRTREIGIRMALGAERGGILRTVLRDGMVLVGLGLGLGLAFALLLSRLVAGFIFGISPADFFTFAGITVVLAGVALIACYVPARKASRIDPLSALRHE